MNTENIVKAIVGLLLLANVVFVGINGYNTYELKTTRAQEVEKANKNVVRIRELYFAYDTDMANIVRKGHEKIQRPSTYFERKLRAHGIDALRNGVVIPSKTEETKGAKRYKEETWKISFKKRDEFFSLRTLAGVMRDIERDAPSFQIKSIDMGKRTKDWNSDSWQPANMVIRRIRPKEKKK